MISHPPLPQQDWKPIGNCQRCGKQIDAMRRNGDYAEQRNCPHWCRRQGPVVIVRNGREVVRG